jgi:hypothetical protein
MKNKTCSIFLLLISFLFLVSGCAVQEQITVSLQMEKTNLPVLTWKEDNSNVQPVSGVLLINNQPVTGAQISYGLNRTAVTDKQGNFTIRVDQSKIYRDTIRVSSLENALVDQKKLTDRQSKAILEQKSMINVSYPVQIQDEQEQQDGNVIVKAKIKTSTGSHFPTPVLGKYGVLGTVKDAEGKPVQGAVVSITRDSGEGWAQSQPTTKEGKYLLTYIPEDDEETNLRVSVGNTQYHLPEGKVYNLPEQTSVNIDITLPKEGKTIIDHPPYLIGKTTGGGEYRGVLVGLHLPDSEYNITTPTEDGYFEITMKKEIWDKKPTFFFKDIQLFYDHKLEPTTDTPKELLSQPKQTDPQQLDFIK